MKELFVIWIGQINNGTVEMEEDTSVTPGFIISFCVLTLVYRMADLYQAVILLSLSINCFLSLSLSLSPSDALAQLQLGYSLFPL